MNDLDQRAPFANAETALRFIFGGNAYITFKSLRTGTWFTYRVSASDDGKAHFVSVLSGPDNNANYTFIGTIFPREDVFEPYVFRHGKKSPISNLAPCFTGFKWAFEKLIAGEIGKNLEIYHESRCGRCGRRLTTPESIASGFGPECRGVLP